MKVVAIIPARSGSKGIPNKNLTKVGGKPLIAWSVEAAENSNGVDRIIVTSDGKDILEFSDQYKSVEILKRPESLAQDNTPTAPVIEHALDQFDISGDEYKYLILLQPTSPLRTAEDIDKALKLLNETNANSLISVVKPDHHPLKSFKKNKEGFLEGIVNNDFPFMPRQELPVAYQPNGAIYVIEIKEFLKRKTFFTERTIEYIMPTSKSFDVDSYEDIAKIESQLKNIPPCQN
ncbi:acylneuraminate cytidylyltransferase family protein [Pseudotenacibaculum sp. MALMAid0570]|uniref:acylneuraminate cytidylyltransferase family protein n=1 Tax=Pseudotenacibaculum sp. MALMAid0570 TaxID=3143938 RepID=UPI0032DEB43B